MPVQLHTLAKHLSTELQPYKVVDWFVRDSVKARIRSTIRVALRKSRYPRSEINKVAEEIISMQILKELGE